MRSEIAFLKKPFWSFYTFSKVLFPTIHKFRWLFDIFYSSSYGRGRGRILQCFCAFLHNSASFPKLGLRKTYRFFWCSSKEGENKLRKQLKWRLRIFRCHCFTLHFPIMCYCPDPQEHIYLVHTYFVFLQYVFFGGLSRSTPSSSCSPGNMHIWLNGTNGVCVCNELVSSLGWVTSHYQQLIEKGQICILFTIVIMPHISYDTSNLTVCCTFAYSIFNLQMCWKYHPLFQQLGSQRCGRAKAKLHLLPHCLGWFHTSSQCRRFQDTWSWFYTQ